MNTRELWKQDLRDAPSIIVIIVFIFIFVVIHGHVILIVIKDQGAQVQRVDRNARTDIDNKVSTQRIPENVQSTRCERNLLICYGTVSTSKHNCLSIKCSSFWLSGSPSGPTNFPKRSDKAENKTKKKEKKFKPCVWTRLVRFHQYALSLWTERCNVSHLKQGIMVKSCICIHHIWYVIGTLFKPNISS